MINIEKYIRDGEVQRSKIALDVADGSISSSDIKGICNDERIKKAFIGASYKKKKAKESWDKAYLDQVICAAAAENFNQDYLTYLSEIGEHIRNNDNTTNNNIRKIIGVIAVVAIIVVIVGIVIWKCRNTKQ